MRLPDNDLMQFPAGSWGFVGRVDERLSYVRKDGTAPSAEELARARAHGPEIVGLKRASWPTREEALAARAEVEGGYRDEEGR